MSGNPNDMEVTSFQFSIPHGVMKDSIEGQYSNFPKFLCSNYVFV